jgi:pimeloyl-ACP methyl ester carboxylesterase
MESRRETGEGRKVHAVQRIVDGQRLRAYRLHQAAADAPILATIHGLEGSWDNWCPLRTGCFEQFTMYSLDLPWNGEDGYYWSFTRPAHDWLGLTLDLLPRTPAVIVAHSYGVNVLLEYLQRQRLPGLSALVLLSAFYRPDFSDNDWTLFERCLQGFRAILSEGVQLRRGRVVEPALLASMVEKVLDHVGPVGFTECFAHFARTPMLKLDRIDVPVLVVAGERDPGASPSGNAALAAKLSAARLAMFPGCGHFSMIEHPELVERAVRLFLSQQRPELLNSIAAIET